LRIGMVFGNKRMNVANPVLLIGVISVEIHLNEQVVVERSGSAARRFLACEPRIIWNARFLSPIVPLLQLDSLRAFLC
jgi:hypothetical protein